MKKSILLICSVMGLCATDGYAVNAIVWGAADHLGDGCYTWSCMTADAGWYALKDPTNLNCADYTAMCFYQSSKTMAVASCRTCKAGYELTLASNGITACAPTEENYKSDEGGIGSYQYTYCKKNCTSSNCASTAWAALRTGYESRTYRACTATGTSGTCNASTQYRCAAGYYGSSSNGTSGCTKCPTYSGVYTTSSRTTLVQLTSDAGTTAIKDCYLKAGTYYDVTGVFKVEHDCTI